MKFNDAIISVIIPVYNVENYLDRCIESVVNQTYQNLEIILVDDGSPDRCPQMCDEWAAKDKRIKVIHKQNQGLGMARNTGIDAAEGNYICFFDSDDFVSHELIEKAYTQMKKFDSEIVLYGHKRVNFAKRRSQDIGINSEQEVYRGEQVVSAFLPQLLGEDPLTGKTYNIPMSAWSGLFSMELIHRAGWRFVSEREIISEDLFSMFNLYREVQSVAILNEPLYYYCENSGSLSQKYRADRYEKIKIFYDECLRLCAKNGYNETIQKRCMEPFLSFTIGALKLEESAVRPLREKIKSVKAIVLDEQLQEVMEKKKDDKTGWKKRLLYWAIRNRFVLPTYVFLALQNRMQK